MNFFDSRMVDNCGWMYGGWKKNGAHTREWMNRTQEFIDHSFSLPINWGVECPCSRCRNALCEDKLGFMPGYEVWMYHGESVHHRTASVAEEMMIGGVTIGWMRCLMIWLELETNSKDPRTPEVQSF
jgi:hypothetical protein